MHRGKFTVLVGGQYGSEGKGAIVAKIANQYGMHIRVGSPNAGHTIYWNGEKHVMQTIPCGWINPGASIVIGRGALINMELLMEEIAHIEKYYPNFRERLVIDAYAGILDEKFRIAEGGTQGEMHKRIGSTGEGVGLARIARIERDPSNFRMFEDVAYEYGVDSCICRNTPELIANFNDRGGNVIVEGTQGSGLSMLHSNYPFCTSIDTNAAGIISEVGVAPSRVTDVLMVCRTYPIRVHGNSGPMKDEITWEELFESMGKEFQPEKTTVTKKVRRIAKWDDELFQNSVLLNEPTEYALTFCDYIDPSLYGTDSIEDIKKSEKLNAFMCSNGINGKIRYFGTGPETVVEAW